MEYKYSVKQDPRVKEVLSHQLANDWGWNLVVLKKKFRENKFQTLALVGSDGSIIEKFNDIFDEGLEKHPSMKKFLIPITYSRRDTEIFANAPAFDESEELKSSYPKGHQFEPISQYASNLVYCRCNYIDEHGNIFDKTNNRLRRLVYLLINADIKDLPHFITDIEIDMLTPNARNELTKLDTMYKIIESRCKDENANINDIEKVMTAWDNRMDELKEDMKFIRLKHDNTFETISNNQPGF